MIRVTILAAHLPVRIGLREMLSGREGIEVASDAASVESAIGSLDGVDVLVMAAPLDQTQTWTEVNELFVENETSSAPAILMLSDEPLESASSTQETRVWGILPLNASEDELEAAIKALAQGLVVGAPALLKDAWRRPIGTPLRLSITSEQLTAREGEVLGLMARGLANKQIAAQLGISEHTVKFHLSSIYTKLGASSRTEALTIGTKLGWIVL